jgi:hypothetical protein
MRIYDLDYLTERVQLINEDRANVWSKLKLQDFNDEIYNAVKDIIRTEGKVSSPGHLRAKTIDYLLTTLLDILDYDQKYIWDYIPTVVKKVKGTRIYTDEFLNWLSSTGSNSPSSQKQAEYGLFTVVKDNIKKILSQDIKKQLLNTNNIIEYLDAPSAAKKRKTGNTILDTIPDDVDSPDEIEYMLDKSKKQENLNDRELAKKRTQLFLKNRTSLSPEDEKYIKDNPRGFLSEDGIDFLDINDLRERVRVNKDVANAEKAETESPSISYGRRVPKTSAFAIAADKRVQEIFGINRFDKDRIYAAASPLISKIKKIQKDGIKNKTTETKTSTDNFPLEGLRNVVDYFFKIRRSGKANNDTDKAIATHKMISDKLLGDFSNFIEDDSITKKDFMEMLSSYDSNEIEMLGKYMLKLAKQPEFNTVSDSDFDKYEEFDTATVKKVLDTPEKIKTFDNWYKIWKKEKTIREQMRKSKEANKSDSSTRKTTKPVAKAGISAETQAKIDELEYRLQDLLLDDDTDFDEIERIEKEIKDLKKEASSVAEEPTEDDDFDTEDDTADVEDDTMDTEDDMTDVEDDVIDTEEDIADEDEPSESISELEYRLSEIMMSDDPDLDEMDRLSERISALKQKGLNESSVMDYFTEQVKKDRLTNTVGEFKERGFKKPKNYHHWLMIND